MKKLFTLLLLIVFISESKASHFAGAEIWYTHISGNVYQMHYRMYRDCSGIPAPSSVTLWRSSSSLNIASQKPLPKDTFYTNNTCPDNRCNTPNSLLGIEIHEYSDTLTLPPANDWVLSVTHGGRNPSNNLGPNSTNQLYVEATLDNLNFVDNNSTIPYAPLNMRQNASVQNLFNFPMLDPDGDVLEIVFTTPLSADINTQPPTPFPVNFTMGATTNNPFVSTPAPSLNSATGNIALFPCLVGDYGFAVKIKEYRNSIEIGSAMRDYLFSFVSSSNTLPTLSGFGPSFVFDTTVIVCPNNNLSLPIYSSDADTLDSTFIFPILIPSTANFTTNTAQNQVGTFSWTPTLADVQTQPHILSFRVKDNNCSEQSYGYRVFVKQCTNLSATNEHKTSNISLYPNPTETDIVITMNLDIEQDVKVSLFDIVGKALDNNIYSGVLRQGENNIPVSLSNYASGMYLLSVTISGETTLLKVNKK